jgi:hypothetical protein
MKFILTQYEKRSENDLGHATDVKHKLGYKNLTLTHFQD